MPKRTLWRYAVGEKTVNRVTVYERPDTPILYVEWYDDGGRHQESLRKVVGKPITDRKLAMKIADRMAKAQEKKRNQLAADLLFGVDAEPKTLGDLLEALHAAKEKRWKPSTKRGSERFKAFWLEKLGEDFRIVTWNASGVERIASRAAKANEWSPRTEGSYLRYLIDASYFAQHKLKWINEEHNLSAVEIPDPESEGIPYSAEEVPRLLKALREVDPRAGIVGDAYWQAGRRLNATRTLKASQVRFDGDLAVLSYARGTDKARKAGEAVLAGLAVANLRRLLESPAVKASGLLCPEGSLSSRKATREPVAQEKLTKTWIREAEKRAEIPYIAGRGLHGIKRAFATEAVDQDAAAAQSGTTKQTLQLVYKQPKLEPKKALALALAAAVD